jgi:hypothetical protein
VIANNSFIADRLKNKIIFPFRADGGAACYAYLSLKQ